ncbi:hypothetical protein PQR34_43785 [Paraburkholderia sediminicola]|uniref:hypothetical protein n=1 Tax=Paraburkholderia sediminicola TaxID=458836 RepID=UPI0038B99417
MSKLFTLKEWLTVPDAARYLSRLFNEDVVEADVLRLAIDGRLKLSVHFVNHAHANPGKTVSFEEIQWEDLPPINPEKDSRPIRFPNGLDMGDGRWLKLDQKVLTLQGVWDLPMIGAESLDVEHEYQHLTNGPPVTLVNIEGAFVEGENGVMCRLCEHLDDNEYQSGSLARQKIERHELVNAMPAEEANEIREKHQSQRKAFREQLASMKEHERYYPASGLPKDGVLVVRSKNLTAFISSLEQPKPVGGDTLSTRERNTLLKIIAALLSAADLKGGTYKQAEAVERAAKGIGINVSVNTIDKYLKEATSIEK